MDHVYTEEQRRDLERLHRYIEREQLRSVMNKTKWLEAIDALQAIPNSDIRFRVKTIREDTPPLDYWDGSFPWHVPGFIAIEWLDIDPMIHIHRGWLVGDLLIDHSQGVIKTLQSVHVPFSLEDDAIRIWGYTRPGVSPQFVEK